MRHALHAVVGTTLLAMTMGARGVSAAATGSGGTEVLGDKAILMHPKRTNKFPDPLQIAELTSRPQLWTGYESTTSAYKKQSKEK